ncbi:MAG: glycosyltransferase [Bacteriovoracaceae bacterium]|nr:glycosyltransferase [Bacteriovoracaceae bacterium]
MHIVQIHHEKVPVKHYGGTERVIEALCNQLIESGHQVTLISYKGDYELKGVNFIDLGSLSKHEADHDYLNLIPKDADIIHFHVPAGQDDYDLNGIPYICTLHGNEDNLSKLPKNTVCISANHATRHKRNTFVYNGLTETDIPFNSTPLSERKYFSFLGKASLKRKGLHNAKKIAKKLKTPLHVGGGNGISLFGTKYLGSLNNEEKFELLSSSKGLLFPIEWEEPFGLVMIEAMFTGSPVFALERGSVSEVLGLEGSKGLFLKFATVEDLISALENYDFSVDPKKIRDYATKYFSSKKMTENYLSVYEKIISGQKIN